MGRAGVHPLLVERQGVKPCPTQASRSRQAVYTRAALRKSRVSSGAKAQSLTAANGRADPSASLPSAALPSTLLGVSASLRQGKQDKSPALPKHSPTALSPVAPATGSSCRSLHDRASSEKRPLTPPGEKPVAGATLRLRFPRLRSGQAGQAGLGGRPERDGRRRSRSLDCARDDSTVLRRCGGLFSGGGQGGEA